MWTSWHGKDGQNIQNSGQETMEDQFLVLFFELQMDFYPVAVVLQHTNITQRSNKTRHTKLHKQ
jgi:hypothetical protein